MWERGEKYFANMTFTEEMGNKTNRWIPLEGTSVVQARTQYLKAARAAKSPELGNFTTQSICQHWSPPAKDKWSQVFCFIH